MKTTRRTVETALTHVVLASLALIWIYPFLWMISTSFKTNAEVIASLGLIPDRFRFENFVKAWVEARFARYFLNTVVTTVSVVSVVLISSAMSGYVFGRRRFIGKHLIMGLIIATMFIPQGSTIIPVYDLIYRLGLLNTLWGVILAITGGAHVVFILLFAGQFVQIPIDLEHAAVIDGCGFVQTFWHVMMPTAKPVAATVVIFQTIHTWNEFLVPLVLTLSKPELRTLAVGLYAFVGEYTIDWVGLSAGATISVMPIIAFFLFVQRYFVKGLAGAIKA